ncbi:MAG: lactate utilization protein [Oscillospiraceae bacterium]|nr:lactate utilization protein [Oscillospiraceae bacterium]
MDIQKAIRNLELRGFTVRHFPTGAEAAAYLCEQVRDTSVGIGGCKTADQLGLYEKLSEHNTVLWHWRVPGPETLAKANAAPVYITSANAISEDGEILNIDGRGNRLAGQVFGNKKLYIVAGVNKLRPDFASALERARNVAAVQNCRRFEAKTPCKLDDKCHDCRSADRICRALLVLWAPMMGMEAEVILIDEDLGM